jgi:hypothetical protein
MALLQKNTYAKNSYVQQAYAVALWRAELADTLGQALLVTGDPKRATEVLGEAFVASNSDPGIGYHCTRALAVAGDPTTGVRGLAPLVQRRFAEQEEARILLRERQAREL